MIIPEAIKPNKFEDLKQKNKSGFEYWDSGKFLKHLGYTKKDDIEDVINKAKIACQNSGHEPQEHFLKQTSTNPQILFKLTRLACYFLVQNGDPEKVEVAKAQSYFASQVLKQQISEKKYDRFRKNQEERRAWLREEIRAKNKHLVHVASIAGIHNHHDFAQFQDEGYRGLYGGLHARDIHEMKNLKKSQHILDYMGILELSANLYRLTLTEKQLINQNVHDPEIAMKIHKDMGEKIRKALKKLGGDYPERLHSFKKVKIFSRKETVT